MDNQQPSLFVGKKKVCRVCERRMEISCFKMYVNRQKTYRKNICVDCEKEWFREHYQKNLEANRLASKASAKRFREKDRVAYNARNCRYKALYRERDRRLIYEAYGNKCACCGEKNPGFFTVDHVNNDGHSDRKSGAYTNGSQFYRHIVAKNFPKNYQLLCFNCNLGKARNGGICPHQEGSETIRKRSRAKRPEVPTTPKKTGVMI